MKSFKTKLLILVMTALAAVSAFMLVGCQPRDRFEGQTKVIFELEGGTFKNSTLPVINYYSFKDGAKHLIKDPEMLSKKDAISRSTYSFINWYKTKTENADGTFTYSDPWNFEKDEVQDEELTLYACWRRYGYNIGYIDDNGKYVVVGSYYDMENKPFSDSSDLANDRVGYTSTKVYYDINGNPWNENFLHPGGDEDTMIDVVSEYMEGTFYFADDVNSLKAAIRSKRDVYLREDIDFNGAAFTGFGDMSGRNVWGNGHTISNFKLTYSDSNTGGLVADGDFGGANILEVSLFGSFENSTVENLTVTGMTLAKDNGTGPIDGFSTSNTSIRYIAISALFLKMNNVTVKDVSISGDFEINGLPRGFNKAENYSAAVTSDKPAVIVRGNNSITNLTMNVSYTDRS